MHMKGHYRIQWYSIGYLIRGYFRLTVKGLEHIPSEGPTLFAANHCSTLDPPILGFGIPHQISTLAKEELFSNPILGWWMKSVGVRPIARGKGDVKAMKTALQILKDKTS